MANLVANAAALADLPRPVAATTTGRSDSGPEEPFAAALVNIGAARVDGGGPPPLWSDGRTTVWSRQENDSGLRTATVPPRCSIGARRAGQALEALKGWGMRAPRSTCSSSSTPRPPPGVRGADDVVLGGGAKLGLVRVQQRRRGPAAQHPGQLPGQVVGALDGGVHAGSPAGVTRWAASPHQEGARNAEPVGELGGEGERADALDPGAAGRRPQPQALGDPLRGGLR
jgi:hypothetical protein